MKKTALVAALFAVACLSLSAQVETKKKKQATSETVYVVKIAGIGGWSAANMAKRARAALSSLDGVENVVVDTTARGVFKMKGDKAPTVEAINEKLAGRLSVKKVTKTNRARSVEMYSAKIRGLGWQDTAISIREMLEKQKGIIAAYPHGDSKMVHIRASKEGALSKESFTKLIQSDRRFKVESFTTRSLMKKGKKGVKPVTMK